MRAPLLLFLWNTVATVWTFVCPRRSGLELVLPNRVVQRSIARGFHEVVSGAGLARLLRHANHLLGEIGEKNKSLGESTSPASRGNAARFG